MLYVDRLIRFGPLTSVFCHCRFTTYSKTGLSGRNRSLPGVFKSKNESEDDFLIATELNGLASSISALCWRKGPNTNEYPELYSNDKSEIDREIEHLLSVERKERERLRFLLESKKTLKMDLSKSDGVSTMKLLKIAKVISGRSPSSGKPQLDIEYMKRDFNYHRKLNNEDKVIDKYYKIGLNNRKTQSIRVLDVDRLPLPILHHMVCYILVKNMPAEIALKVISKLSLFRDKNNKTSYQHLFKNISYVSSPICTPELIAVLSRAYQSISIPFMVDYVRKFGTFSRKFISNLIDNHSNPLPLDFLRYKSHQKGISNVLTRPWALSTYVNLLKNSSAKKYMYLNLLQLGYVANMTKFENYHSFGTLDTNIASNILSCEKLLNVSDSINNKDDSEDLYRPEGFDDILESYYNKIPLDIHRLHSTFKNADSNSDEYTMDPTNTNEIYEDRQGHVMGQSHGSIQNIKVVGEYDLKGEEFIKESINDCRFYEHDNAIPYDRGHISWSVPWGIKRDRFFYKGKSYILDQNEGWIKTKSIVRINYLKNVQMNKRKRMSKSIRKLALKLAKSRKINNHIN